MIWFFSKFYRDLVSWMNVFDPVFDWAISVTGQVSSFRVKGSAFDKIFRCITNIRIKEYDISTFFDFLDAFFGLCEQFLEYFNFISWLLFETRRCTFTSFYVEVPCPMDVQGECWCLVNLEWFARHVSVILLYFRSYL